MVFRPQSGMPLPVFVLARDRLHGWIDEICMYAKWVLYYIIAMRVNIHITHLLLILILTLIPISQRRRRRIRLARLAQVRYLGR